MIFFSTNKMVSTWWDHTSITLSLFLVQYQQGDQGETTWKCLVKLYSHTFPSDYVCETSKTPLGLTSDLCGDLLRVSPGSTGQVSIVLGSIHDHLHGINAPKYPSYGERGHTLKGL